MRTKKLLSVLLAVIMVIGLLPSTVFAAETTAAVAEVNGTQHETLQAAVAAANGGTITLLTDIKITEETTFNMVNGTVLDLNGKTIKGDNGKAVFAGTNFTIQNGTVTGINGSDYYAITIDGASTQALRSASNIVLEDLTFTNTGVKIRGGATVTLKDNAITANQSKFEFAVWAFGKSNVTIESGTYFGGKNGYDVFTEGNAKFVANGGTYKFKIVERNIVNEHLAAVKNANGTYTVKIPGIHNYEQLVAAIAAATAGDTIKIDESFVATDTIVINKSITLDLGAYTITGDSDEAIVRIYSDVVDTPIDVTINATTGGIVNNGTGYAIYAGKDLDGGNDGEKTNLTIEGGTYVTAGTDCIKQIMGLCTINGGSYKSSYGRTVLNGERWYGSEFRINGGMFYEFNPACVSVWTGFDGKNYDNFYHQHDIIAAGKTATYEDGWYTVVAGTYTTVAEVKSMCYPSLEAALKASIKLNDVANLGVITLLADDTLDLGGYTEKNYEEATITLPKGLVIDLNGKTLTIPYQKALFAGENITIKNGTITTGSTENYGLYIMSGSFTLENVTTTNGINVQAGNVTLNNVTAKCPNKYYAVYAGANADVTILSGNYSVARNANVLYADGKITVYGGTFSKDPSAFVAEGYYVFKEANGYVVSTDTPVAAIDNANYRTLQAAIDAAKANETVTLLADINEQIVINKSITLDLDAYTITGNSDEAIVRIYSDVVDTVIDVTINATTGGIVNTGTGYAIYAGEDLAGGNDSERTNLTIEGGTYESNGTDCIRQIMGLCTINGGSYKSSYGRTVLNGVRWYGAEFQINGGKFYEFNPACVSVWTGFDGKNYDNFYHQHDIIAAGKTATYEDGWYTVVAGTYTPVAEVKSMCYPSLEAALNASIHLNDIANLGVITLIADDTLNLDGATITLPKGLVIDLNGKTLTLPFQKTLFAGENITIKNGTITTGAKESYGLFISAGSFTLENVTTKNGICVNGGAVTLKDCEVINPNSRYYAVYAGNDADVTILSGTYQNPYNTRNHPVLYGSITVYGGSFSTTSPNAFVAQGEDLHVVKSGSWYTVYKGFQTALDAAEAGDTVYLMSNIEATESIVINESITLDLGAYTITGNSEDAIVRIYSDVVDTVIDVTIDATTGGVVNNGNGYAIFAGEDLAGGNDDERTNLTINDGTYATAGTDCIKQIMGLCTINNGFYKSSFGRTVLNGERWYGAEFAINGGSFYGFNPACVSVWTGFDGNDYTNFYHQHDIIATGKTATYSNGWYTVVDGTFVPKASTKALCFGSVSEALNAVVAMKDVRNLGIITLLDNATLSAADIDLATVSYDESGNYLDEDAQLGSGLKFSFVLDGHTLTLPEGYELYDVTLDGNRDVKMIRAISNAGTSTDN